MQFGIVYSKNTGRIRSIVVPENKNEQQILDLVKLNIGEALIRFDMKDFAEQPILQDKLNEITGLIPKDDRFIVVNPNTNQIESIIIADEKIDSVSGKKMIKNAEATPEWTYNKITKKYIRPVIKETRPGK
jgi:hypothetical protein